MIVLNRVFDLLEKYVHFDNNEMGEIRKDAGIWEAEQKEKGGFIAKMLEHEKRWYVRVLAAVLYLWGVKQIADYLMKANHPELFQEDEDDESQPESQGVFKRFGL